MTGMGKGLAECKYQVAKRVLTNEIIVYASHTQYLRVGSLLALLMHLLVSAVSSQTDGVVLYLFGAVDNKPCSLYGFS